jgi:hypothetical protein
LTDKRSVAKFGNPFKSLQGDEPTKKGATETTEPTIEETTKSQEITQAEETAGQATDTQFLGQFFEEKQTQEKTHSRKTFVVENELLAEIQKYMKKFGHGFQVRFINEAIRNQLKIVEQEAKLLKGKRRPK